MRRSYKKGLAKYTVFVPKTVRATKRVGKNTIKGVKYFLKNSVTTLKKLGKNMDKRVAKSLSSLTRRGRRY